MRGIKMDNILEISAKKLVENILLLACVINGKFMNHHWD